MRVKCVANSGKKLLKTNVDEKAGFGRNEIFLITPDKEYVVYAITTLNNCMWYYIAEDIFGKGRHFPIWHPAELFKIVCNKISRTWVVGTRNVDGKGNLSPIISFSDWVKNGEYYERLADGDKEAYKVFLKYKKIMDKE
jgi:hypothetical protein